MLTKTANQKSSRSEQFLVVLVSSLYVLQLMAAYPYLWVFAGLSGFYVFLSEQKLLKVNKKLVWILLGVLTVPLLLNTWAQPGSAEVLLTRVQEFFGTSFGGEEYGDIINLIFNSARGFYIMLLLIAAWQGWQSYQQQDEMGAFVRNMLYSLAIIFSVDVFSNFVVPEGAGVA